MRPGEFDTPIGGYQGSLLQSVPWFAVILANKHTSWRMCDTHPLAADKKMPMAFSSWSKHVPFM